MARPSRLIIDHQALLHNIRQVRRFAPQQRVIAMVKANAYGCGLKEVISTLDGHIEAFGVASIEEALYIRKLGSQTECILFQGVFSPEELTLVAEKNLQCVIHQETQLRWLLESNLSNPIKVWVKVNTGMNRLGFAVDKTHAVLDALQHCLNVEKEIGLLTHLANAELDDDFNHQQIAQFNSLHRTDICLIRSIANSAAIMSLPAALADVVRPGIMMYGVSPFPQRTGAELGLIPVMRFMSKISAIHTYPPNSPIGYNGKWLTSGITKIGIIPAGYGDGYPRHISSQTMVGINGCLAPIVGRVSMDMLTVDLSNVYNVDLGDEVELWGRQIPVEHIAQSAGTIAYELLCQISPRVR
jgi:alanine racemase